MPDDLYATLTQGTYDRFPVMHNITQDVVSYPIDNVVRDYFSRNDIHKLVSRDEIDHIINVMEVELTEKIGSKIYELMEKLIRMPISESEFIDILTGG